MAASSTATKPATASQGAFSRCSPTSGRAHQPPLGVSVIAGSDNEPLFFPEVHVRLLAVAIPSLLHLATTRYLPVN